MPVILAWIVFAVIVGMWATKRGRSGLGWFFLALIISPLFAGLFLAVIADLKFEAAKHAEYYNQKTCPKCAEDIKVAATVCRYCGHEFSDVGSKLSFFENSP